MGPKGTQGEGTQGGPKGNPKGVPRGLQGRPRCAPDVPRGAKIGQEKTIFYNSSASAADQEQTKITPATLFKNQQPCKFFKNSSKNSFSSDNSNNNKNTAILYKWDKRSQIAHFHVKFDDSKIVYNVNYSLFYLENKINNEGKVMLCTLWLRCYCTVKILVTVTFLRVVVWVNFFCITQQRLHMHDNFER